jgi:2-oxoglutarate ferredoxin oxidoreductase subunit gamma
MVPIDSTRDDVRVVYVPALEIAGRIGAERVANMVMLGSLLAVLSVPGRQAYGHAIASLIGGKRPELVELNLQALDAGHACALEQLAVGA